MPRAKLVDVLCFLHNVSPINGFKGFTLFAYVHTFCDNVILFGRIIIIVALHLLSA